MDYTLDEQQSAVKDLAAQILAATSTREARAERERAGTWFDETAWHDLAEAGLVGIAVPEEQGGSGAGFVEACLVVQEAARASADVHVVEPVVLAALPLSRLGTPEQQQRLLAPFCAGELLLTSALETSAGRRQPELGAEPDGDGFLLRGTVQHVPLAERAARVLVRAVDESGRAGLFLLDAGAPGVEVAPQSSLDRRSRSTLVLAGARVDAVDVLRAPGELDAPDERRIRDEAIAARCVAQLGSCERALRLTADHVSERQQFGRPLATFQAVAQRAADAYIDVAGVRLTTWRAVWLLDRGTPDAQALATAAFWAADAGSRVVESAMHLHGGLSVDLDYPLHRYYLAVKQGELHLGGPASRLEALADVVAVG